MLFTPMSQALYARNRAKETVAGIWNRSFQRNFSITLERDKHTTTEKEILEYNVTTVSVIRMSLQSFLDYS